LIRWAWTSNKLLYKNSYQLIKLSLGGDDVELDVDSNMPSVDQLMQEWPSVFEDLLKEVRAYVALPLTSRRRLRRR